MNIEATKLNIVQAIVNITDEDLLNEIQQFLEIKEPDWFDHLLPEQQQDIQSGIKEADKGKTVPHSEIVKLFGKWGMK